MKPDRDGWFGARGVLGQPRGAPLKAYPRSSARSGTRYSKRCSVFWWQAFDQICGLVVLIRLSIEDRIYGPEPPTFADLEREANYEAVSAFPLGR
jgi:hypothetical protein